MWFFKSKLNSDEYEKLSIRLTEVESNYDKLIMKFQSLRGLIHRKATGDFDLQPGDPDSKERIDDGLDELRKLNKQG